MGLFDDLAGTTNMPVVDERDLFCSVLIATIDADGRVRQEEADQFFATLGRMAMYRDQSDEERSHMVDRVTSLVNKFGTQAILDRANEVLSEGMKETVFAIAVDIALADGVVELTEKELLNQTKETLGISDDLAEKIVDVMLIRNRG
jgi:tellurite resistance protein